jgi:putative oxidoreductase
MAAGWHTRVAILVTLDGDSRRGAKRVLYDRMWQRLVKTDGGDVVATVLRLTLGIVFFPHGAQKLLGWFGGAGVSGTQAYFLDTLGMPPFLTLLVIVAEFFGSLALILGFVSRVAAAGIAVVMPGAVFMVNLPNGFFMNWSGAQAGEGIEFHRLVFGMIVVLLIRGAGALSLDDRLGR